MDFRDVCQVFGGTPFYDDLHTDIAAAHARLEIRAVDVLKSSVDQRLSVLLLRAIHSLLQGDFVSATEHLDCLLRDDLSPTQHTRWTFRRNAYLALLCVWRDFPPLLQPCNLRGPALAIWKNRVDYDDGADFLVACAQYEHEMSEIEVLEYRVIRTICKSLHMIPMIRRFHRRPSDHNLDMPLHKRYYTWFSQHFEQINGLVKDSLQFDLPLVAAYLLRTQYNLARVSGDSNAIRYLDLMQSIYSALKDDIGRGQYCLIRGDYAISPDFTCPSILNLVIIDSVDDVGGDSTMHFAENAPSGDKSDATSPNMKERIERHCSSSHVWYTKAKNHFRCVQSIRGLATVTFREACSLSMRRMCPDAVRADHGSTRAEQVLELLAESNLMTQRCFDKQLGVLIEVHQLLHMSGGLETRSRTHQIAHWARDCGNVVFALGLALFALRLGHYNRYIAGMATNTEGYEVCRQIIKQIRVFWTVWYLAMLAQFRAWLSLGLRSAATIWVGHLKDSTYLLAEDCTTTRIPGIGSLAIDWILKAIVDAEVLLGPADDEVSDFPDDVTRQILERLSSNPFMSSYVCEARTDLRYSAAMTEYQRNLQNGELEAAQCALQSYLDKSKNVSPTNLRGTLQHIDILYQFGSFDEAEVLLSRHVDDNDTFSMILPILEGSQSLNQVISNAVRQCKLKSLETIFLSCIKVKLWPRAVRLMSAIEEVSPGYFTSVTAYTELWPWQRCLYAGLVRESQRDFQEAYLYFLQGRLFLLEIADSMTDDDFRLVLAKNDATRLLGSAARRALLWKQDLPECTTLGPTSNPAINCSVFPMFATTTHYKDPNDHFIEALVFLEAARPQYIWSDGADDFTPQQAEAQYKSELWKELMQKKHRNSEEEIEFQALHPLREEYSAVFKQTSHLRKRTLDLSLESVGSFFRSVPENAIVLYIFATQDGCIVMALDNQKVRISGFCPDATLAILEKTVIMFVDAIRDNDTAVIQFSGNILDNILIKPLGNCIAKRSHVIFVLSGILTRIPVSALRYQGDYLILKREVSQVPSLRALHSLQSRRPLRSPQQKPTISVIARPGGPRDRWLPMAGIEASLIGEMFNTPAINAKDVGREAFRKLVRESHFLHICTHGLQDSDHPFNSQIILEEKFRVLDLLAVRGDVGLVTFSACHSGVGHASDSGDLQGFSHAVLAAGAHAYLGALWKVNDIATMIHMWIFYANLWIIQDQSSFSEAWQLATQILYELTTEEAIAHLEQFVEFLDASERHGKTSAGLAGKAEKRKLLGVIKSWKEGKNLINFKEPRMWAPFVMVGNASRRVWTSMQSLGNELLKLKKKKQDISFEEFIAYCKRQKAIQTGHWEGQDEAPVPKEFVYPSWNELVSYGGFEGNDEAPVPEPSASV